MSLKYCSLLKLWYGVLCPLSGLSSSYLKKKQAIRLWIHQLLKEQVSTLNFAWFVNLHRERSYSQSQNHHLKNYVNQRSTAGHFCFRWDSTTIGDFSPETELKTGGSRYRIIKPFLRKQITQNFHLRLLYEIATGLVSLYWQSTILVFSVLAWN